MAIIKNKNTPANLLHLAYKKHSDESFRSKLLLHPNTDERLKQMAMPHDQEGNNKKPPINIVTENIFLKLWNFRKN